MRYLSLIIAFICICTVVGCGSSETQKSSPDASAKPAAKAALPVAVQPIASRTITDQVLASGTIEAFRTVVVSNRVAGIVEQVLAEEGDVVVAGAPIAIIDGERYRLAVAAADAQHQRSDAMVAEARSTAARITALGERASAEQRDQAATAVARAEADAAAAVASQQQAQLDQRHATIIAPIAGAVQSRAARLGAWLPVGATVATLVERDPLQVRFLVESAEAAQIAVGTTVSVRQRQVAAPLRATVRLVSTQVETGTRQVAVLARLEPMESSTTPPWPGTFVEVAIPMAERTAVVVPGAAVRTAANGARIFVVRDGRAASVGITLGRRLDDGTMEVLSGVQPGEVLIVQAADSLRDGQEVRVIERESAGSAAPAQSKP